jgi:hypothetical protein
MDDWAAYSSKQSTIPNTDFDEKLDGTTTKTKTNSMATWYEERKTSLKPERRQNSQEQGKQE